MCHVVARMEAPCSPRAAAPDLAPLDSHNGSSKILGRNSNGTMVVTAPPGNEAELQLYRVLQRASLLAYYDTLLEMGGDDVQQLCDAGEEEFLEIMALVGMASKPLHVRRFQKALQEWVTNPAMFQIPIVPNLCQNDTPFLSCSPRLLNITPSHPVIMQRPTVASPDNNRPMYSPSPGILESSCGSNSSAHNASPVHNPTNNSKTTATATSTTANSPNTINSRSYSPVQVPTCPPSSGSSPSSVNCSPVQLTPCLLEVQILRLAAAAERLSKRLPQLEPKPQNTKKKMCKDLEAVLLMPENDPRRMEEIRKYAAIYGRFDCKRKPEKPLTLHEVSVNEAAAQMCRAVPALLTRRDELFPLARQVVRLSGFHYSKGNSQITSTCTGRSRSESDGGSGGSGGAKRARGEHGARSDRGEPTPGQDKSMGDEGSQRGRGNETDVENSRHHYTSSSGIWSRIDSDDGDSRYSFSNSSSPPLQDQDDSRTETEGEPSIKDSRVRVVAASGDHIIAVANPALALSRSILSKRESGSSLEDN